MKKILLTLITLSILAISCQEKIDVEIEKEAIMKVNQEEGDAFAAGDLERMYAIYVQDESCLRLTGFSDNKADLISGWDQVKAYYDNMIERNKNIDWKGKNIKENVIVNVAGNSAWLVCDNIWDGDFNGKPWWSKNFQIAFFEKIDGKWKISFNAFISIPKPVEETTDEDSE